MKHYYFNFTQAEKNAQQKSQKGQKPNAGTSATGSKNYYIDNMSRVLPVHRQLLTVPDSIIPVRQMKYGGIIICKHDEEVKTYFNALDDSSYAEGISIRDVKDLKHKEAESMMSTAEVPGSFTFDSSQLE